MALPYTHTTLATARAALAQRLDPSTAPALVYWTGAELNSHIVEALRCWQAYTSFYRERVTLATNPLVSIYNLVSDLANPGLFDYNVDVQGIYNEISNHLLEPPTNPWTGTDQFTLDQINQALTRRRDQFLTDTGCVVTRTYPVAVPAPPISRVPLPGSTVDVRRLAWVTVDAFAVPVAYTPIFRGDEYSATSFLPSWPQSPSDPPNMYSVSASPPLSVQLIPPPLNGGLLELLSVATGGPISTAPPPVVIPLFVPDDFAWVVKWGALADLLSSDGQSTDRSRAAYCETRYRQGVALAMLNPSVVQASINDVPVQLGTIYDLDYFSGSWQSTANADKPIQLAMAGRNLLAVAPTPDAVGYSISMDLVRNMPVPVLDGDFLQVSRDALDPVLDLSQHLASFKLGGAEFDATAPLYQNFIRAAAELNSRLRAANVYDLLFKLPALAPTRVVPRTLEATSSTATPA